MNKDKIIGKINLKQYKNTPVELHPYIAGVKNIMEQCHNQGSDTLRQFFKKNADVDYSVANNLELVQSIISSSIDNAQTAKQKEELQKADDAIFKAIDYLLDQSEILDYISETQKEE